MSQSTRVSDRQTDGRTDRIFIVRPRLHSMQRGKNVVDLDVTIDNKLKFSSHINGIIINKLRNVQM